uniref:C2 domain-containing protein n=1 Tax=Meloidogyne floridensis TaxID=298350 RepID=A0A915P7S0_9BILA
MRRPFDFGSLNKQQNIVEQLTSEQIDHFTALVNSCEQVRRCLACADRLKLDEIEGDGCYDNAIFHLVWSPSACPTDDCLKPLIKLLDGELSIFTRVMYSQVHLLLKLFQECVNENIGQEPIFYRRLTDALAILLDFFHADGKGISVESFAQSLDYRQFHEQISLYQMSTENLIELYYSELIKAQEEVTECKYGILNLRAYFNPNSQLLVIEVLSAKQIIPLDSNGLSDPYVVIELLPKVHFPDINNAKTKVVSSCLNPVFGETFEFNVPSFLPPCALAHFVIMDHDFLKSNDFAGEAFLDLRQVPGFATDKISSSGQSNLNNRNEQINRNTRQIKANNSSSVTNNPLSRTGSTLPLQFNLVLTHPSSRVTNPTIMAVLASRKEDKEADEFIRSLSATY